MQAAAGAGPNGKPPITVQELASPRAATGTRTSSRRHRRRPTSDDSVRHLHQKNRLFIQPKERRPPPTPSTPTRCKYGCGCWFLKSNRCVFVHDDEDFRHHELKTEKLKDLIELSTKEKLARLAARAKRPALGNLTNDSAADKTCSPPKEATVAPTMRQHQGNPARGDPDQAQAEKFAADAYEWLHHTFAPNVSTKQDDFPATTTTTTPDPILGANTQWRANHLIGYRTAALFNSRHPQKLAAQPGDIITATEIVFGDSGEPHPNNGYRIPFIRNAHGYLPLQKHHSRGHPDHHVHLFEQVSGTEFKI